jgi:hypothetical protein
MLARGCYLLISQPDMSNLPITSVLLPQVITRPVRYLLRLLVRRLVTAG